MAGGPRGGDMLVFWWIEATAAFAEAPLGTTVMYEAAEPCRIELLDVAVRDDTIYAVVGDNDRLVVVDSVGTDPWILPVGTTVGPACSDDPRAWSRPPATSLIDHVALHLTDDGDVWVTGRARHGDDGIRLTRVGQRSGGLPAIALRGDLEAAAVSPGGGRWLVVDRRAWVFDDDGRRKLPGKLARENGRRGWIDDDTVFVDPPANTRSGTFVWNVTSGEPVDTPDELPVDHGDVLGSFTRSAYDPIEIDERWTLQPRPSRLLLVDHHRAAELADAARAHEHRACTEALAALPEPLEEVRERYEGDTSGADRGTKIFLWGTSWGADIDPLGELELNRYEWQYVGGHIGRFVPHGEGTLTGPEFVLSGLFHRGSAVSAEVRFSDGWLYRGVVTRPGRYDYGAFCKGDAGWTVVNGEATPVTLAARSAPPPEPLTAGFGWPSIPSADPAPGMVVSPAAAVPYQSWTCNGKEVIYSPELVSGDLVRVRTERTVSALVEAPESWDGHRVALWVSGALSDPDDPEHPQYELRCTGGRSGWWPADITRSLVVPR